VGLNHCVVKRVLSEFAKMQCQYEDLMEWSELVNQGFKEKNIMNVPPSTEALVAPLFPIFQQLNASHLALQGMVRSLQKQVDELQKTNKDMAMVLTNVISYPPQLVTTTDSEIEPELRSQSPALKRLKLLTAPIAAAPTSAFAVMMGQHRATPVRYLVQSPKEPISELITGLFAFKFKWDVHMSTTKQDKAVIKRVCDYIMNTYISPGDVALVESSTSPESSSYSNSVSEKNARISNILQSILTLVQKTAANATINSLFTHLQKLDRKEESKKVQVENANR
jgi:hypothetical protein